MAHALNKDIAAILTEGKDMTVATLRPDGWPQATTVSYASDGAAVFFGCGDGSQKARNLAHDSRVSITINLPYQDWAQIRGLSLSGHARRLTDPDEIARAALLFMAKFPEVAQYITGPEDSVVLFRVDPEFVSVLDYRHGFGHTELVRMDGAAGAAAA